MKLNINDYFVVKLTPAGERAWSKYWKAPSIKPQDALMWLPDGRVKFQIWEAMFVFGPDCYLGSSDMPFEGGDIEVVKA